MELSVLFCTVKDVLHIHKKFIKKRPGYTNVPSCPQGPVLVFSHYFDLHFSIKKKSKKGNEKTVTAAIICRE